MELWLDAHISPLIASWIRSELSLNCFAVKELGFLLASDTVIFNAARSKKDVIVITKDADFCSLLNKFKSPPKIIWLTFGNCSNSELKVILRRDLFNALSLLSENDLVEISRRG